MFINMIKIFYHFKVYNLVALNRMLYSDLNHPFSELFHPLKLKLPIH